MYGEEKRAIILDEGVPVVLTNYKGAHTYKTKALIGKASKQSFSEIAHESHRKGHFLPEMDVRNGLTVHNEVTNDKYLILSTMLESYGTEIITKITRLVMANASLKVVGLVEEADENGDITSGDAVKVEEMPIYVQLINGDMQQYQPGQFENSTYSVYAPAIDFNVTDKLTVNMSGRKTKLKIQHVDYMTFEGLAVLYVKTETRA